MEQRRAGMRLRRKRRDSGCSPPCGPEMACRRFHNNTSKCVCAHDSSTPTPDNKCPRLTVPVTPQPIPVIVPTSRTLITAFPPSTSGPRVPSSSISWDGPVLMVVALALVAALLGGVGVVCLWRRHQVARCVNRTRKQRKDSCNTQPSQQQQHQQQQQQQQSAALSVSKGLLEPERYTPNPQYTVCPSPVLQLTRDSIRFVQEIGEGCFGKVYKGELLHEDGRPPDVVAVKVLKEAATREAEDDLMREVEIMSAFRHHNILALIGVVPRGESSGASPWMVFEFMAHGDLAEVLRANSRTLWRSLPGLPPLNKESLLLVAQQVAEGMNYLAAQRFVHRDLAARNCLVGAGFAVKIADFGMSRDVYTCDYYKVGGSRLLPVRWMAPESVIYGRFTLESDIWSFGVVLWEIYGLGKQPYYGKSNEEAVGLILNGQLLSPPEDCPETIRELMLQCWRTDPKDRPRFPDLVARLGESQPTRLPRPPGGFPLPRGADLLDADNYLLPSPSTRDYLQPLPD